MRILYTALKYDYGRRNQGYSFEHFNFYDSLIRMGHDILYFDIGMIGGEIGRQAANRRLLEVAKSERPDVLFTVLFRDELEEQVIREISECTNTTTIAWFSDDHWRFDSYSMFRAPWFNWSVTTSTEALAKYRALGFNGVLKSQWACNPFAYTPMDLPKRYAVSFVGLAHGNRPLVIQALRDAGIDVSAFGKGWENGRVSQDEMIRIFNQSSINLNLANASTAGSTVRRAVNLLAYALAISPVRNSARQVGMRALSVLERLGGRAPNGHLEQIKGRNFEVPGCRGFLLTPPADNLNEYYIRGSEVACYVDKPDLIAQVRRFLADAELRAHIAEAGYQRTLREHTYPHRFDAILGAAGFSPSPLEAILKGHVRRGSTEEVV